METLSNTSRVQKGIIIKLFHNTHLQGTYLNDILPGLWNDKMMRYLVFLMKELQKNEVAITLDNLLLFQSVPSAVSFRKKEKQGVLKIEELEEFLFDIEVDSSPALFEELFSELHNIAFASYVAQCKEDFTYEKAIEAKWRGYILARAKSINSLHSIIFKSKFKKRHDPIENAMNFINDREEFIKTFSPKLNGIMGGWTRGFANTLLGRSGHTKSTIMRNDSVKKIITGQLDSIDVIAAEEPEQIFWRGVFAQILKIPIQDMRNKIVKITPQQAEKVRKLLGGKLRVHQVIKFKDIVDLLYTLRSEFIWIDHINSIKFPGSGNDMQNMIGGIPSLIHEEVEYLRLFPRATIVNLSQVNEKELMKRTGNNVWKHPSYTDAYGSQVLHQTAREYLTIYYPQRDVLNNPKAWTGKRDLLAKAKPEDVYVKIEKSSFGDLGEIKFKYNPEIGDFQDTEDKASNIVLASDENLFTPEAFDLSKFGLE